MYILYIIRFAAVTLCTVLSEKRYTPKRVIAY